MGQDGVAPYEISQRLRGQRIPPHGMRTLAHKRAVRLAARIRRVARSLYPAGAPCFGPKNSLCRRPNRAANIEWLARKPGAIGCSDALIVEATADEEGARQRKG